MEPGAPVVSLVSRCSSLDEFIAAFRGFVHRDHVFVPTRGTIAAGRKTRIAITLADGTPVIAGEAEVLSSSVVPQGPYQKPGVRLRFLTIDDDALELFAQIERARSEPAGEPAGPALDTGARADIVAIDLAPDPAMAAMCEVVEASAPATPMAAAARMATPLPGAVPTLRGKIATPPGGGVPGKSFKIPSIPSIPSIPTAPSAPKQASSGATAVAVPRETTDGVSGDLTVPTDPQFREPSMPFGGPSIVVTQPPTPAGKARNRTLVPGARRVGESGPQRPVATGTQPAPTAPVAVAPVPTPPPPDSPAPPPATPAPPPTPAPVTGLGPPPGMIRKSRTLIGVPAMPTPGMTTRSVPLEDDGGWSAPEDGGIGDATERSITPAPVADVEPSDETPAVPMATADATTLPVAPETWPTAIEKGDTPVVHLAAPVLPPPVVKTSAPVLRAGPAAPTLRTPQSMLELGTPTTTPLPGMRALPPPIPHAPPAPPPPPPPPVDVAIPQPVSRDADETELVRRDHTDQLFLPVRRLRPVVIAIAALGVIAVGIVLGLAIGRGGSSSNAKTADNQAGKHAAIDAAAAPAPAPKPATVPPDAGAAPAPAPKPAAVPPDAAPATPAAVPPDAAPTPTPTPTPPTPAPPTPGGTCTVAFTTTPPGAVVVVGGKRLGTTPFTATVPCEHATATIERPRYEKLTHPIAPRAGEPLRVALHLERPSFSVHIISSPGGASVAIGGRAAGRTPLTTKVPGFEAQTVKVSKAGYQTKSAKLTAKKNGAVLNVSLKKSR